MMVDFNPDKIYRYIPKNLSYEEKYKRYYADNAFLQALQLCSCRGDSNQTEKCVKKTFSEFLQRAGYSGGVSSRLRPTSAACSIGEYRSSNTAKPPFSADKPFERSSKNTNAKLSSAVDASAITSPTLVGTALYHEISSSSLCALDLASLPGVKSSTPKPKLLTKSNGEAAKMEVRGVVSNIPEGTEKNVWLCHDDSGIFNNHSRSSTDPSSTPLQQVGDKLNCVELLLGAKLETESDVTGTDFSEDYTQMTYVGDASDLDALASTGSYSYDFESDSTPAFSDRSDLSVFEDSIDLERVTINFDHMAVYENDADCINCNNVEEEEKKVVIVDKSDNDSETHQACNASGTGMVTKSRFKEKELPKIKLFLGHKPELNGDPDSDSKDIPVFKSTPKAGTLFDISQEFDFLQEKPVKRSTSLKTNKTPPGTPHRKKEVRFADVLGLDLEDVRHVMNTDDPPKIPASAMKDLKVGLEEEHKTEGTKYLSLCFSQPGATPVFVQRVMDSKVLLENCAVNGQEMTVSGTIRVANIGYHKRVVVRFTVNDWKTCTDVFGTYVQNSNDGATDRFSFSIGVPNYFQTGDRAQFAILYETNGQEFWDNNGGRNYIVECYATAVPLGESDNLWMHFL